jgi:hypothetical protein
MVFYFVGLSVAAVGKTAGEVVREVRRQFKENPDIMTFKVRPRSHGVRTDCVLGRVFMFQGSVCRLSCMCFVIAWEGAIPRRHRLGSLGMESSHQVVPQ